MSRLIAISALLLSALAAEAGQGNHIATAVLQTKAGASVASAMADANGTVRFMNVPPGEYRLVLTNAQGRSVVVADLDGDGRDDIVIEGAASPADAAGAGSGMGSGKVNVQDISMTRRQAGGSPAGVVSPRDAASGLPTGKRMHKPLVCLVDWDGTVKGGFASESVARMEGERMPDNANGRCAIRVRVDDQPGTIEVLSWSWPSQAERGHTKTGHVTLIK